VDRAELRVSICKALQNSLQGIAELHAVHWSQSDGVLIYSGESVIYNRAGAAFALWHNPARGKLEVLHVLNGMERKDYPKTFFDVIFHIFNEEVTELMSGAAVCASAEGFPSCSR
jgi:hypothetical protein